MRRLEAGWPHVLDRGALHSEAAIFQVTLLVFLGTLSHIKLSLLSNIQGEIYLWKYLS